MKTKTLISKENITWFDLETTGLDINISNLVSIYAVNYKLKYEINSIINPEVEISNELIDIHGIDNDMVKDKPVFSDIIKSLTNIFGKSKYIAGYNICNYDIPLVKSLLERHCVDFDFSQIQFIDVYHIIKNVLDETDLNTLPKRNLSSVYKLVTEKELVAHNAFNDVIASIEILEILDENGLPWRNNILSANDLPGAIISDINWVMKSGKNAGKSIDYLIKNDKSYLQWMVKNNKLKLDTILNNLIN